MAQMAVPRIQVENPQTIFSDADAQLYGQIGQNAQRTASGTMQTISNVDKNAKLNELKQKVYDSVANDLKNKGETNQGVFQAAKIYIDGIQDPQHLLETANAYNVQSQQYDQFVNSLDDQDKPFAQKYVSKPIFGSKTLPNLDASRALIEKARAIRTSQGIADVQSGAAAQQSIQNTLPNQPAQGSPQLTTRSLSSQLVGPELSPAMKQFPETTPEGNVVPMAKDQSVISPIRTHAGMLQTPQNLPQPTPTPEENAATERTMQMYQSPEQMASADRSTSGTTVSSDEAAGAYSRAGVSESPIAKTDVAARQKAETLQQKEGTAEDKNALATQKLEIDKEKAMQQLELKQKSLDWQKEYQQGILDAKKEFNRILAAANNVKAASSRNTTEKDKTDLVAKLMKMKVDAQEKLSSANMLFGDEKGKQDITTSINDIEDMITRLQNTKMSTGPSSGVPIKPKSKKDPLGIR